MESLDEVEYISLIDTWSVTKWVRTPSWREDASLTVQLWLMPPFDQRWIIWSEIDQNALDVGLIHLHPPSRLIIGDKTKAGYKAKGSDVAIIDS